MISGISPKMDNFQYIPIAKPTQTVDKNQLRMSQTVLKLTYSNIKFQFTGMATPGPASRAGMWVGRERGGIGKRE